MIEAARSYGANTSGERRACDSLLATGKENIMAREISNQVQYYYDYHPTEEDLMGETAWHSELIDYLKAVLLWLFHDQTCAIYKNLNFYQTFEYHEYPVAPDLAVIKGVPMELVRSWGANKTGMPPHVVFEILSEETWKKDLREKPIKYASMGVQEYFAYDPYESPISRATARRLFGWRLDARSQQMVEMQPDTAGWLWSKQLQCWLAPDGHYLRLYDRELELCLTREEAQTLLAEEEAERANEEAERAREAIRKAEALAEKLRSLGINPDEIA